MERKGLLIDSCGADAVLALFDGQRIKASESVEGRRFSAAWTGMLQGLLSGAGWDLSSLQAVGVVHGPGSFTGVRVGLAAAKGLCEARALPLATVSRLEVLRHAARMMSGYAVVDAGRGEFFVRYSRPDGSDEEVLWSREQLLAVAPGHPVAVAESSLMTSLEMLAPELYALNAAASLPVVLRAFTAGGNDAAQADANYVRGEQQIYGKAAMSTAPDAVA